MVSEGNSKTIAALARQYDVSLRTLRFYEQRGLLSPLRVGLARFYSRRDETKLRIILKSKSMGFSIAEIGGIISSYERSPPDAAFDCLSVRPDLIDGKIDALSRQRESVSRAIEELKAALARVDAPQRTLTERSPAQV